MSSLIILIIAILIPFADIFLRALGFWIFLPDVKVLFSVSLPLFFSFWIALPAIALAAIIQDIFLVQPFAISSAALLATAFISRVLSQRWFSLLSLRSRFLFSIAISLLSGFIVSILGWLQEEFGVLPAVFNYGLTPFLVINAVVNALFIFAIISGALWLRRLHSLEIKS